MNNLNNTQSLSLKRSSAVKIAFSLLMALSTVVLIVVSAPSFAAVDKMELDELVSELGYSSATKVKRISTFKINGFNTVNEESVIINGGPSLKYLVTTSHYCRGLNFAFKIGTTTTIRDVTRHDNIIVSNGFAGREVCPIQDIYKLEGKV